MSNILISDTHQLFGITDLLNIIVENLTIGERKFLQGQKCNDNEILEAVKNCLDNNLGTMAHRLLVNYNVTRKICQEINFHVLMRANKRNLVWLKNVGLLMENNYYELVF